MILPHILDIVSVCAVKGIKKAIISPGSRSAALTIAFEHHPDIEVIMVPDERSAAFIALGLAQQSKIPSALVCTSGSALLNYYPAVAEAYYQEIPLIIFSADRPPEWIDQYDGQTVQQKEVFGKHVKKSFELPTRPSTKDESWHSNRIINEAVNESMDLPHGPVHINVPIREPFYPADHETIAFKEPRIIERPTQITSVSDSSLTELAKIWNTSEKPIVVIGHQDPDSLLSTALSEFSAKTGVIVINDIISNQHHIDGAIMHHDAFLNASNPDIQALRPDLIISLGKSLISKNLKLFLRDNPAKHHWHIQESTRLNDGLQNLTHQITSSPTEFFKRLGKAELKTSDTNYGKAWKTQDQKAIYWVVQHTAGSNTEFAGYGQVMKRLPDNSQLQLANSMAVRYANIIGLHNDRAIEVYANRGTSGIDGSNATAVGAALSSSKIVTLLTGDMAFLYDRNAFWHKKSIKNLRIVVFNNSGGGIFRMIPGPTDQPAYESIFETKHDLNAKATAKEFGMDYQAAFEIDSFKKALDSFFEASSQAKVLEYFTDAQNNSESFKAFKNLFTA